jgi:hypothetical protein
MSQIILNRLSATATLVDVVAPAGVKNGNVVVLGAQGTNKTYACAAISAVTDKGIVFVAEVPLSYEVEKLEKDFVIATGAVIRAIVPYVGFVASIPTANITATVAIAVTKIVVPKAAGLPMECLAAAAGTEVLQFVVDEVFTKAGVSMTKIRCIVA